MGPALPSPHGNILGHHQPHTNDAENFLCQGPRSSGASSVLGSRQGERVSLFLPGFDDDNDNDDDKLSEKEVKYNYK